MTQRRALRHPSQRGFPMSNCPSKLRSPPAAIIICGATAIYNSLVAAPTVAQIAAMVNKHFGPVRFIIIEVKPFE